MSAADGGVSGRQQQQAAEDTHRPLAPDAGVRVRHVRQHVGRVFFAVERVDRQHDQCQQNIEQRHFRRHDPDRAAAGLIDRLFHDAGEAGDGFDTGERQHDGGECVPEVAGLVVPEVAEFQLAPFDLWQSKAGDAERDDDHRDGHEDRQARRVLGPEQIDGADGEDRHDRPERRRFINRQVRLAFEFPFDLGFGLAGLGVLFAGADDLVAGVSDFSRGVVVLGGVFQPEIVERVER
ncbi:MAG: hypothetical protein QM754_00865 [Tepidisphaeraceae bacterium]